MKYVTHKREDGTYQLLLDHLVGVAELSARFAEPFGGAKHAKRTGLLHDIGKYSQAGQQRQLDPEHTAKVDHSTAGAQIAWAMRDIPASFAIAGHHGGLPDPGSAMSADESTLANRMRKQLNGIMDSSDWQKELTVDVGELSPLWLQRVSKKNRGFANALYTRMLFSCLVDADYLDTETFMSYGITERNPGEGLPALLLKLKAYVEPWLATESKGINLIRNDILKTCLRGNAYSRGLFTMTVPTGGGKTVSSLAFALSHAVCHGMARVIYVVPYTSIIEQNANVFREILGETNVLEHHANVEMEDERKKYLATENWDAPVVVTTAVQFFESLFASKPSRCRKLHGIANSVIIFDEAQMLPVPFLKPCVYAITELVHHYGVTAVLCTATQPALGGLILEYAPESKVKELIPEPDKFFVALQRTKIVTRGVLAETELATYLLAVEQVLCVVNLRRTGKRIFSLLPKEGSYHLSTFMTPQHRIRVLKEIRARLENGLPCRVVSTSLIEAGVDVDFPNVWREKAGLDSIIQAAGRCNREGRRSAIDSIVQVFSLDDMPNQMYRQNIAATDKVLNSFEDIASPDAIKAYFHELLFLKGDAALDAKEILKLSDRQQFRTVDSEFQLIEDDTIPVYIPAKENEGLLEKLRAGEVCRGLMRQLGRYAVNIRPAQLSVLKPSLDIYDGFCILRDACKYDLDCGLDANAE